MTLLQGHFAMIVVVSIEDISSDGLQEELKSFSELSGFSISVSKELSGRQDATSTELKSTKYIFHLAVSDTPGIVARVTKILGSTGANVVDCSTRKNSESGVFSMILDVDVPVSNEDQIVEMIQASTSDYSGDVVFQRVDDVDL